MPYALGISLFFSSTNLHVRHVMLLLHSRNTLIFVRDSNVKIRNISLWKRFPWCFLPEDYNDNMIKSQLYVYIFFFSAYSSLPTTFCFIHIILLSTDYNSLPWAAFEFRSVWKWQLVKYTGNLNSEQSLIRSINVV